VIQVLVYAGGIMVLIIFVIMILNLTGEELAPMRADRFLTSIVLLIAGGGIFLPLFFIITAGIRSTGVALFDGFGTITEISKLIFGKYIFPFEILSLVLLTAIVGSLVIAKRKL
jgi:NADH-quinone oxidoreductase subunit J